MIIEYFTALKPGQQFWRATYEGRYEYRDGLCPTAEGLLPRLINTNCMISEENAKRIADSLTAAIEKVDGR